MVGCSSRFPLSASRSAFTLVELLTAIGILAIIMAILFSAFEGASNATLRNNNKIEVNQVVRAVMDQMTRDIERLIYLDQIVNLYQPTGGTLFPGMPTNTVYFLSDLPAPEPNPSGSFVNVGYRIAWTNIGSQSKAVLMRGDDPLVDTASNPTDWWTVFYPNTTSTNPIAFNDVYWKVLSENIIGFELEFYTNTVASGINTDFATEWTDTTPPCPIPYSVGLRIFAIDTDTYDKALRVSSDLSAAAARTIITNNMREYYTRIFIPQSTLNP